MTQRGFDPANWVGQLTARLDALVSYEKEIEYALSDLQGQGERVLGLPGSTDSFRTENIRERIAWSHLVYRPRLHQDSEYQRNVSARLNSILEILREHPILDKAIHTSDDKLVIGLDLAVHRLQKQPVEWMVRGLVDYAVEHGPKAAADAFARMIQSGDKQDLTSYSGHVPSSGVRVRHPVDVV